MAWAADTQAGEKNTGVAQLIKQSDGAIGYVDFADAKASSLVFAAIKNKDGKYVAAVARRRDRGAGRCRRSRTT